MSTNAVARKHKPTNEGSKTMKRLLAITGAAVLALTSLVSSADDYKFIVSGDPVAAATANSSSSVSSGNALVSDALTAVSASKALEARFRTWCASIGRALRTDDWSAALMIILR